MAEFTEAEQRLLDDKACFERLFKTDDGKRALIYLKQVTGHKFPLPLSALAVAEGARRTTCLIDILSEPTSSRAFLMYAGDHLINGKFLQ